MPEGLLSNLLVFARALRTAGVSVRAGGVADAVRALGMVGVERRRDVREALRAVLTLRHEDSPTFDEIFERFWRVLPVAAASAAARAVPPPALAGGAPHGPVPAVVPDPAHRHA